MSIFGLVLLNASEVGEGGLRGLGVGRACRVHGRLKLTRHGWGPRITFAASAGFFGNFDWVARVRLGVRKNYVLFHTYS